MNTLLFGGEFLTKQSNLESNFPITMLLGVNFIVDFH